MEFENEHQKRIAEFYELHTRLVRDLVMLSWQTKNPHLNAALSALPIIVEIFQRRPKTRFILSAGHAYLALVVYLLTQKKNPCLKYTHPEIDAAQGIEATTGSLGHGLPMAIGLAIARPDEHVDVLLGDNEAMEGTTWEGLHLISGLRLKNITVHINNNGRGAVGECFSPVHSVMHDLPFVYVNLTKRGHGIKYCEAHPDWHKHDLTEADYNAIMEELDERQ